MKNNYKIIKETIFDLVDFNYDDDIVIEKYNGVKASYDGKIAVIGCNNNITMSRALFLLAQNFSGEPFEICEKA